MSTRFYEEAVKDTLGKFVLTLWNSYNFFATYAALDKFDAKTERIPIEKRELLDKWIISRFNKTVSETRKYLETFEIHKAARAIENFVIEDFSNWYLRRSRKRLWVEEKTNDKLAGYSTMYDIFLGLSKTLAPFIPFITEEIYLSIKTNDMPESIHLCDYPETDKKMINEKLEEGMDKIRKLVEIGRALRSKTGIKVRCPLNQAAIVCKKEEENLIKDLLDLLNEEINVKNISFARDTTEFMTKTVRLNYSHVGPKLKEKARIVNEEIEKSDKEKLYKELMKNKKITMTLKDEKIQLTKDDFEVVEQEKTQYARSGTEGMILFLDTTLTPELESEGFAREIVRRIQSMRKELGLNVEDTITTEIRLDENQKAFLQKWKKYIEGETRSKKITFVDKPSGKLVKKWDIDELNVEIGICK